jgi:malate dehydrogenase
MVKAVVLGASGGIGQPLSLLLKINPSINDLGLYDVVNTPGVAADLSHIATPAKVVGHLPSTDPGLKETLTGAQIVVIPAGLPRKPGMTRDDLFNKNAKIIGDLAEAIAEHSPNAFVLVISNPVNSTVPIVAEIFKKKGVYDPKRLFGVTTLDVVRASTFVAEVLKDLSLSTSTTVPVVGGHSGVTIVPLLSQTQPPLPSISKETIEALTKRIQFGGDEVVKAKDGAGSATLSMAHAGYLFATQILEAAFKGKSVTVPTYVDLNADKEGGDALRKELGADLQYFSTKVTLGPTGVEKIHPLGDISEYERELIKAAIPELKTNIDNGVSFVASPPPKL